MLEARLEGVLAELIRGLRPSFGYRAAGPSGSAEALVLPA